MRGGADERGGAEDSEEMRRNRREDEEHYSSHCITSIPRSWLLNDAHVQEPRSRLLPTPALDMRMRAALRFQSLFFL